MTGHNKKEFEILHVPHKIAFLWGRLRNHLEIFLLKFGNFSPFVKLFYKLLKVYKKHLLYYLLYAIIAIAKKHLMLKSFSVPKG